MLSPLGRLHTLNRPSCLLSHRGGRCHVLPAIPTLLTPTMRTSLAIATDRDVSTTRCTASAWKRTVSLPRFLRFSRERRERIGGNMAVATKPFHQRQQPASITSTQTDRRSSTFDRSKCGGELYGQPFE